MHGEMLKQSALIFVLYAVGIRLSETNDNDRFIPGFDRLRVRFVFFQFEEGLF